MSCACVELLPLAAQERNHWPPFTFYFFFLEREMVGGVWSGFGAYSADIFTFQIINPISKKANSPNIVQRFLFWQVREKIQSQRYLVWTKLIKKIQRFLQSTLMTFALAWKTNNHPLLWIKKTGSCALKRRNKSKADWRLLFHHWLQKARGEETVLCARLAHPWVPFRWVPHSSGAALNAAPPRQVGIRGQTHETKDNDTMAPREAGC